MPNASPIRCLITAGPTREFIDPVRFVSNPSTGKMGFALAAAAVEAGLTVDLVAGPVALEEPAGVVFYPVVTAGQMLHQVDALFDACDVLIMTAAVSDFRPKKRHTEKEKKEDASMTVEFEPTVDILETMAGRKGGRTVVGFAAETREVETYAKRKWKKKRCDWMVANDISREGSGFAADTNEVLLIDPQGTVRKIGLATKREIAKKLISLITSDHRGSRRQP